MYNGFHVISTEKNVDIFIHGKDKVLQDTNISFFKNNNIVICTIGRLYVEDNEISRINASKYIYIVYEKSGIDGLIKIQGDFAFALINQQSISITAMRDIIGGYPLYWYSNGEQIILTTNLSVILRKFGKQRVNNEYIADFLSLPHCGFAEVPTDKTIFENVNRILPNQIFCSHKKNIEIIKKPSPFSNFVMQDIPSKATLESDSYIYKLGEEVTEILTNSIKLRAFGITASHLSGGYDSTGISLLSRKILKTNIVTISQVYPFFQGLKREIEFINSVFEEYQDIFSYYYLLADKFKDFSNLDSTPILEEPSPCITSWKIREVTLKLLQSNNINTLFMGIGGDELFNVMSTSYIESLLAEKKISFAWAEAKKFGLLKARTGLLIFLESLSLFLSSRSRLWHQLLLTPVPWLNKEFAETYSISLRCYRMLKVNYWSSDSNQQYRILNTFVGQAGHVLRWKFAQSGNTHVTFPFLDMNLIRYSMTIPDYFRVNRGQEKPILAAAFKDILPKKIINRRTRCSFLELVLRGINENYELIKTIILDSDSHNFISPYKMVQYLDNIYYGKTVSMDLIDKFCLTLAILIWYDRKGIMYSEALSQVDFLIFPNSLE